jgi:hypothetical protein
MSKTMGTKLSLLTASLALFAALEGVASAAEPKGGVITLREIEIVGRVQKPVAVAEVGRIQPRLLLSELRQPFLDRIEEAVQHDPF